MFIKSIFYKAKNINLAIVFLLTAVFPSNSYAQNINILAFQDNYKHEFNYLSLADDNQPNNEPEETLYRSPTKAAMLSATFPGLGQVYNHKYWKLPIIYGGFVAIAYAFDMNNERYQHYRRAYYYKIDGNPHTEDFYPQVSADRIRREMNRWHRYVEITYIVTAALYILNILDASVDAHLMDFDISEDLSMNIHPAIENHFGFNNNNRSIGLRFAINF